MNARELRRILEESNLSATAYDIVNNVIDYICEEPEEYDIRDEIMNEIDSQFMYYDDAWNYLQEQNITDFTDAIREFGVTDIMGIASYYLLDEIEENFLCEVD